MANELSLRIDWHYICGLNFHQHITIHAYGYMWLCICHIVIVSEHIRYVIYMRTVLLHRLVVHVRGSIHIYRGYIIANRDSNMKVLGKIHVRILSV